MKVQVISKIIKGEEIPINSKGCDEIEIASVGDIDSFSFKKDVRYIGLGKGNLYRLSLKSYKELKKFLQRNTRLVLEKIV